MSSTTPALEIQAGDCIGGCRIVRLIGRGGMGAVYEAQQISLERRVAVKVIRTSKMSSEAHRERFTREARLAAKLNHPNIVQVFDVGQEGPVQFIIMEFLEGITLKTLLNNEPRLPASRLIRIATDITRGLAAAHAEKVVHRDIKPENILLTSAGMAKIADFGAASFLQDALRAKSVIGTPGFVAPEILRQGVFDGRADMYSLGLMLYTAAVGTHPFKNKDRKKVLADQLLKVLPPLLKERPGLPQAFAQFIDRMCGKIPQERPSSAEFLALLASHREWERFEEETEPKTEMVVPLFPVKDASSANRTQPAQPASTPKSERKPEGPAKSIINATLMRDLAGPKPAPVKAPSARAFAEPPEKPEKKPNPAPPPPPPPENPVAKDLAHEAIALMEKKEIAQAEETFRAALRLEPRNRSALLGIARLYTEQLRYKEAVYELYVALVSGRVTARAILEDPSFVSLKVNEGFRTLIGQFWI